MKLYYQFWIAFLTILLFSSNSSIANVKIQLDQVVYQFDRNPRMVEVLSNVTNDDSWYWQASKLYRLDSNAPDKERKTVVSMLAKSGKSNSKYKAEYQSLINQIKSWDLADRLQVPIDYDYARVNTMHNPMFDDGNYLLQLNRRPASLYVFGAVAAPKELEYVNNKCLSVIMKDFVKNKYADLNYLYLILPTGVTKKVNIAYWNKDCVFPAPGSQVFVPLRENQIFEENTLLNQSIADLAVNRVIK